MSLNSLVKYVEAWRECIEYMVMGLDLDEQRKCFIHGKAQQKVTILKVISSNDTLDTIK
jgi:hypothetical protein